MNLEKIIWNEDNYIKFIDYLYSLQDIKYRDFHKNLILNNNLIGIRTPILKQIAKEISIGDYKSFIKINKHNTYEEIIIHGLIIGYLKDYNEVINELDIFMLYINNWAINDIVCANLNIFKKYQKEGFKEIQRYLKIKNNWVVRFGLVLLIDHYINDNYIEKILDICNKIKNNDNYVMMANAWLISICYIKYKDITYRFLLNNNLDKTTFNKTINKICDSKRISKEEKEILKKLK